MITEKEIVSRVVALETLVKWLWAREFKRSLHPEVELWNYLAQIDEQIALIDRQRSDAPTLQATFERIALLLQTAKAL